MGPIPRCKLKRTFENPTQVFKKQHNINDLKMILVVVCGPFSFANFSGNSLLQRVEHSYKTLCCLVCWTGRHGLQEDSRTMKQKKCSIMIKESLDDLDQSLPCNNKIQN